MENNDNVIDLRALSNSENWMDGEKKKINAQELEDEAVLKRHCYSAVQFVERSKCQREINNYVEGTKPDDTKQVKVRRKAAQKEPRKFTYSVDEQPEKIEFNEDLPQ